MAGEPVTQRDVARAAGVSRALVSMAMSGSLRVAASTRRRILEAAAELGYSRDLSAALLSSKTSEIIGVVLPNLMNPYFEGLVTAVESAAGSVNLLPLLATASNEPARELSIMERFRGLRARGVIAVSPAASPGELRAYGEHMPLVVIGDQEIGGHVDASLLDEQSAARLVVDHLVARGWRELAYLFDPSLQRDRGLGRRREALTQAADRAGLPLRVVRANQGVVNAADMLARRAASERLAVVAHNDLLATEAMSALRGRGLRVGVDVAVVGYDDTHLAARSEVDLTSVAQPMDQLIGNALEFITTRAEDADLPGRERTWPARLAIRATT